MGFKPIRIALALVLAAMLMAACQSFDIVEEEQPTVTVVVVKNTPPSMPATSAPRPTATPLSTSTLIPTATPRPTITLIPTPRPTLTSTPTPTPTSPPTSIPAGKVAVVAFDQFGIQQLYPTAMGGLTWDSQHWNNGTPRSFTQMWDPYDPTGWSRHSGSQCITIDGNRMMSFNKDCGASIHPRLYVDPVTKDGRKFKNVEMTAYHMRVADADLPYAGFVFGARSGPYGHNRDHCQATTYYARIGNDGKSVFTKELTHPTTTTKSVKTVFSKGFPFNKWVGMKFIIYNTNYGQVKFELYMDETDGANGGTWRLINEFVDDGSWSGGQDIELPVCIAGGLFPDGEFHVIREGNGVVFIRDTDVTEGRYKWFTVREIAGPVW